MKKCPSCKAENPDTSNFCRKCGKTLAKPSSQKKVSKNQRLIIAGSALALAIAGGVSFAIYDNSPERRYRKNIEMAAKYMSNHDYSKAEEYLITAKSIDPKSQEVYEDLYKTYTYLGDTESADEIVQEAQEILPVLEEADFSSQLDYIASEAISEAIEDGRYPSTEPEDNPPIPNNSQSSASTSTSTSTSSSSLSTSTSTSARTISDELEKEDSFKIEVSPVGTTAYDLVTEIGSLEMAPIVLNNDCWLIRKEGTFQFLFPDGKTKKIEDEDQLILQMNLGNSSVSSACLIDNSSSLNTQYYPTEKSLTSCLANNNEKIAYSLEGNYKDATNPILVKSNTEAGVHWIYNPLTDQLYGPYQDSQNTSFYSKVNQTAQITILGHNGQIGGPYWTTDLIVEETDKKEDSNSPKEVLEGASISSDESSKNQEDSSNEIRIWRKNGSAYTTQYTNPIVSDWYTIGAFRGDQFNLLDEDLEVVYAGPFEQGGSVIDGIAPVRMNGIWKLVDFKTHVNSGPSTNYSFVNTLEESNENSSTQSDESSKVSSSTSSTQSDKSSKVSSSTSSTQSDESSKVSSSTSSTQSDESSKVSSSTSSTQSDESSKVSSSTSSTKSNEKTEVSSSTSSTKSNEKTEVSSSTSSTKSNEKTEVSSSTSSTKSNEKTEVSSSTSSTKSNEKTEVSSSTSSADKSTSSGKSTQDSSQSTVKSEENKKDSTDKDSSEKNDSKLESKEKTSAQNYFITSTEDTKEDKNTTSIAKNPTKSTDSSSVESKNSTPKNYFEKDSSSESKVSNEKNNNVTKDDSSSSTLKTESSKETSTTKDKETSSTLKKDSTTKNSTTTSSKEKDESSGINKSNTIKKDSSSSTSDSSVSSKEASKNEEKEPIYYSFSQFAGVYTVESSNWSNSFKLHTDGTFEGEYVEISPSNNEEYPEGIKSICSYSGTFTVKENHLKITSLSLEETPREIGVENGMLYEYVGLTDSCMSQGATFTLYGPGTPYSSFSTKASQWLTPSTSETVDFIMVQDSSQLAYS